jgi:hypothetical protein
MDDTKDKTYHFGDLIVLKLVKGKKEAAKNEDPKKDEIKDKDKDGNTEVKVPKEEEKKEEEEDP